MAEYRNRRKLPPAKTPQDQEDRLIILATDLAEHRLRMGTASATEVTHILKLATAKEKLEREKLEKEVVLLEARVESMAAAQNVAELYAEALKAMTAYAGQETYEDDDE